MKAKFDKTSRLLITAENDNEKVLLDDFLKLQATQSKQVLRVPHDNDGKTLVIEKRQYITKKFLEKAGFEALAGTFRQAVYYNHSRRIILYGYGTYRLWKRGLNDAVQQYIYNPHQNVILKLSNNQDVVLEFSRGIKIQTLQEFYDNL